MLAHYCVDLVDTTDPHKAVQLARDTKPSAALVDYYMPLMDGPEVIRQLRAEFPRLIIGAISGAMCDQMVAECKAAGADFAIIKAFDGEALVAELGLRGVRVFEYPSPGFPLETVKELYVVAEYEANDGNIDKTARILQIDRNTVKRYLRSKKKKKK